MTTQSTSKTKTATRKRAAPPGDTSASAKSAPSQASAKAVAKAKGVPKPDLKPQTKKSRLIVMLQSKSGATVEAISTELGWQQHTTRAALTGLRKVGYVVEASKPKAGSVGCFRIIETVNASAGVATK